MNRRGFTLVEFLIVVTIIGFLAGVIYITLARGLELWHRANQERPELNVEIFFEKITQDIRNAFIYEEKPFEGAKREMKFYSVSPLRNIKKGKVMETLSQPAKIRYAFDSSAKTIKREICGYPHILYDDLDPPETKIVLDNVLGCAISYYEPSKRKTVGVWHSQWLKDYLPQAIKISVDVQGYDKKKMTKIIPVPAGGMKPA
ncbi:MAG: prepilin-type N-terminal cleavage/methylation domain-containing protein [Candidatus Omnitrophica bacterium]|nr:prepilin-type N-terminal cleavage/methylation domain-containing protein [Candidatus Omnitrophota bacterium]